MFQGGDLTERICFVHAEISEYQDGRRRSLSVQEGSTALIECPLPHSVPPARPRLKVRGDWIDASRGTETIHNVAHRSRRASSETDKVYVKLSSRCR